MIDLSRLLAETSLKHAEWLDEIDSTNTRALTFANEAMTKLPFVIGAEQQTAGRGRGANLWWGASGSLMFSIGIDLASLGLTTSQWPRFSLVTGLAIAEAIEEFLPSARVGLKWPNDVWIDQRKVCGILIEQATRIPSRLIVGIGINVNNSFEQAPDEQRRIAVSMRDAADGHVFNRTEILLTFFSRWVELAKELSEGTINLADRWSHSCVLSGHPVTVTTGGDELTGICGGIDEDGCLLLRTAFTTERCYAGTVRLLN